MNGQSSLEDNLIKPASESYSQKSNPDFENILALRTAAIEGAFLIPHLRG